MNQRPETGPAGASGPVIALTAELLFGARVRSTAEAVSVPLVLVRNAAEMVRSADQAGARLVIIDLDVRTVDPVALIRELKAHPTLASVPILAYVSHVREDLIEAARSAGADSIMARGAFARQLPQILSSHA